MTSLDCTDIKALLSGLVDDEVDAPTRHQAERHLVGCASCRALLSEVEALSESIAEEAAALAPEEPLSADFVGAVLSRTVYAQPPRHSVLAGLINWTGWLAAAAAVLLAATIWFMDRRPVRSPSMPETMVAMSAPAPSSTRGVRNASYLRSTVYEGDLAATATEATDIVLRTDAENVWTAALLVDMLAAAEGDGATELRRIRDIAGYEDLLANLTAARQRGSAADRPALFAAQAVLMSVMSDTLGAEDVLALRQTVEQTNLAGHLYELSSRWDAASSL